MSRGGRRAAAVVAVVVMLGVAWLVRGALRDGGTDGGKSGTASGDRPTLVCASELGDVCTQIEQHEDVHVVVEPAATTAAQLESTTDLTGVDVDGWLTIAPQTGIVNDAQDRNARPAVFGADETIARSPLVFAVPKERAPKLVDHCRPAPINWTCLADVADRPWTDLDGDEAWGNVVVGHSDPARNTVGLLAVAHEATSNLPADFSFADVHADDFSTWFLDLEQRERPDDGAGPLAPMIAAGAGMDVAEVSEAEACTALHGAARAKDITVVVPTPVVTASVVFAPVHGRNTDAVRDAATGDTARTALARTGWRTGDTTARKAVCDAVGPLRLPANSNVPAAGKLAAIRDLQRGSG